MTQTEYEQKKRECWEEFKRTNLDGEVQWQPVSRYDVFCAAFDRAYALGKKFGISEQVDAEGEEILTVSRKRVQEMYAANERIKADFPDKETAHISDHINHVLKHLFGSKCLPDNVESSEPNVDSLPQNPTENCDNKSHISTDCDKPAEPKFKVGDIAVVRGFNHPLLKQDGAIVTILSYHDKGDFYSCAIAPNVGIDVDAKYLEPYTEPTDFGGEVNFPTKNNLAIYLKKSKNCDNRLQIAAMAMQGILSNIDLLKNVLETGMETLDGDGISYRAVAKASFLFADALITESKGGDTK